MSDDADLARMRPLIRSFDKILLVSTLAGWQPNEILMAVGAITTKLFMSCPDDEVLPALMDEWFAAVKSDVALNRAHNRALTGSPTGLR